MVYLKMHKGPCSGKYGKLTILGIHQEKSPRGIVYKCACDCGAVVYKNKSYLRSVKTPSCGCAKKDYWNSMVGEKRSPEGQTAFNDLYSSYKSRCDRNGITFNLSKESARLLFESECKYCGVEYFSRHKASINNDYYNHNGIDRIIPSLGYIDGNCVSCCEMCNRAKFDLKPEEFERFIRYLVNKSKVDRPACKVFEMNENGSFNRIR